MDNHQSNTVPCLLGVAAFGMLVASACSSGTSSSSQGKGGDSSFEAGFAGADASPTPDGGASGRGAENGGAGGTVTNLPAGTPAIITGTFLTTSPADAKATALSSKSFRIRVDSTEPIVSSGTMYSQHFTISTSIIE